MSAPRGLSEEEAEAWEKVAATVKPLDTRRSGQEGYARHDGKTRSDDVVASNNVPKSSAVDRPSYKRSQPSKASLHPPDSRRGSPVRSGGDRLDSHWDRRLKSGALQPEITLDLHGHNLDAAYDRLVGGVAQARAIGARTILLVTGKSRPVDPADRGTSRGAIRAKVLDWLAASSHHSAIAAVRRAHIRHGGDGALYIVLKRER